MFGKSIPKSLVQTETGGPGFQRLPPNELDLISLELEPEDQIDLRCMVCNEPICLKHNKLDTLQSVFYCHDYSCGRQWTWHDLLWTDKIHKLHHFFYVRIPIDTEADVWKMVLAECTTGLYHTLRRPSRDELFDQGVDRVIHLRNSVMKKREKL